MEGIEFFQQLQDLKIEYDSKVDDLKIKYALSHNTVKVGDIVTDHIGCVKVEEINVATPFGSKLPCCLYKGMEYTKKGEPKKNGGIREVWQDNLV
jgi:hypothetical protein